MRTSSLAAALHSATERGELTWNDWYPDPDQPVEPEAAYLLCTLPDGARVALRHGILPYEYPLRRYTLHALDACGELAGELPTNRGEARLLWKTAQRKNREVNLLLAAGEEIARKEANRLVQDKARNSIQSLD